MSGVYRVFILLSLLHKMSNRKKWHNNIHKLFVKFELELKNQLKSLLPEVIETNNILIFVCCVVRGNGEGMEMSRRKVEQYLVFSDPIIEHC